MRARNVFSRTAAALAIAFAVLSAVAGTAHADPGDSGTGQIANPPPSTDSGDTGSN